MVPANTDQEFYLELSYEIKEHIEACRNMTWNLGEALMFANLDDRINIVQKDKSSSTDSRETSACPTKLKVYGRDQERDLIIRKLIGEESEGRNLSVLAIIGDGGVGKTTLAKVVFNDSAVSKHFDILSWVYVSVYFDQAKIIHILLESLKVENHENIKGLKDLQSTLESTLKSKRFLIVLDDMWEDSQKESWDELLTPLLTNDVVGNKILVTTRKPSVAKLIGETDPIVLLGLKPDDFWDLFKECAFGNENYKGGRKLEKIGEDIVIQLKGNPLAAKSVGRLLRKKINVAFWKRVLDESEWKQQSDDYDIMPALMISYKYLPVHLQRCFSYCAVFPKYYKYEKECLVNIWIAQGLIYSTDMHKRLEDIGSELFNDLVEWGFLQQEFEFMSRHIMHDLIHDLAQKVSSHESFTIGDTKSQRTPQFVRHVSVLAEWVYKTEIDGTVHPNQAFLQKFSNSFRELQKRNLSTLMLFGPHDLDFANAFRQEFIEGKSVRVLKLDMVISDLDFMIQNISSFINLRYLELGFFYKGDRLELPEAICKLHYLQVLDIKKNWGSSTILPRGMNKLVNLRHFIAVDKLHAQIAGVGSMTDLQELKAFSVRKTSEFSIKQLKGLNQLRGSISICYLDDVESQEEAIEARISDKVHLTALHLSWYGVSEDRVLTIKSKLPILEDLKPHAGLINLRITAYKHHIPSWFSNNIHLTSLRSLHLDSCYCWETIPTPDMLPLLRELRLINMIRVSEIEIGCLEILELRNLRRLRQCKVSDKEQLCVNLQVLEVDDCIALKQFSLLFIHEDVQNEYQFTHLRRLRVRGCFGDISISQLLHIQSLEDIDLFMRPELDEFRLEPSDPLNVMRMEIKRSGFVLSKEESLFQSNKLRDLVELKITDDPSLMNLAWSGLQQLASLKTFKMSNCRKLFSRIPELSLPPSVQELEFNWCNITAKQLSQVLLRLPLLKKFSLTSCEEVTSLPIGLFTDEENQMTESSWYIPPNLVTTLELLQISFRTSSRRKDSSEMHFSSKQGLGKFNSLKKVVIDDCPTLLSTIMSGASQIPPSSLSILHVEEIKNSCVQLSELSSLIELHIIHCEFLTWFSLDSCAALQELWIAGCDLVSSLEGLQSCKALRELSIYGCKSICSFGVSLSSLTTLSIKNNANLSYLDLGVSLSSLTTLSIENNPSLAFLDLNSCTAMQKLCIEGCATMSSWKGLKSLSSLEYLNFENSPGFTRSWQLAASQVESEHSYFPRRLQVLIIDNIGVLCVPICSQLTSLKTLTIHGSLYLRRDYADSLTDDNERALLLLTSLRTLEFDKFKHLQSLPAGLQCLTSLQRLSVSKCELITSLPVGGFPASLKDMEIHACSKELTTLCREVCRVQKIYFTDGTGDTD
ncbi:putative disease resistance RPP13-like protein 1 [Lolium perenne]